MREMGSEFRFRTHTPEEPPKPPEQSREIVLSFSNPVTDYLDELKSTHPQLSPEQLHTLDGTLRVESTQFQVRETSLLTKLNSLISKLKKRTLSVITTAAVVWSGGACDTHAQHEAPISSPSTHEVHKAELEVLTNVSSEKEVEEYSELRAAVGDSVVDGIMQVEKVIQEKSSEWFNSKEVKKPIVGGFEDSVLGSNEYIHDAIDILPHAFKLHVHIVQYEHAKGAVPLEYGLADTDVRVNAANNRLTGTITFYKDCNHKTSHELLSGVLVHEIAHAFDWVTNKSLTTGERMDFLSQVVARVQSENRFRSRYVESVNNTDKQVQLFKQASEYWAEIVEEYYTYEHGLLPREDIELVEYWLQKTDPDSNPRVDSVRVEQEMFALSERVRENADAVRTAHADAQKNKKQDRLADAQTDELITD